MDKQKWKIDFHIDFLKMNEEKIEFSVDNSKLVLKPQDNNIKGEFFVEILNDKIDKLRAYMYAKSKLDLIFNEGYSITTGSAPARIAYDEAHLLNNEKFEGKPIVERAGLSLDVVTIGQLKIDGLNASIDLLRNIDKHKNKEIMWRVIEWYRKGEEETNPIDCFIMRWISFNSLYSAYSSMKTDRKAIKSLLNDYPKKEKAKEILVKNKEFIKQLSEMGLTDWRGEKDYSASLKVAIASKEGYRAILVKVGQCLWIIRNQIFHGGKKPGDLDFVSKASSLLRDILIRVIHDYTYY